MRKTMTAMMFAAGLLGLGATAQAAPVSAPALAGLAGSGLVTDVQMMRRERRMMRQDRMERRMMRRRMMRRSMYRRGY